MLYTIEKITEKSKDVLIISINIDYELRQLLTKSIYKSKIVDLPGRGINDVLFVLKKADALLQEHKEIKEDDKLKYKLEMLNEKFKMYAS